MEKKAADAQDADASSPEAGRDAVDRRLAVWARELPALDLATEGIVERIQSLYRYLDRTMNDTLTASKLSYGEWKLLGSLRYGGAPYRSSPGRLAEWLGLSSGAMTNRLDRMESAGLVRRLPDPDDRRGIVVELTDEGRRVWEETVDTQAEKESLVADALDEAEKEQLNELLRRLLVNWERVAGPEKKGDRRAKENG